MADQRNAADTTAPGCDYLVRLPAGRTPRILQLTDMQVIDATQQRYSGRLNEKEIVCWAPENADAECYGHIRSLVAQHNRGKYCRLKQPHPLKIYLCSRWVQIRHKLAVAVKSSSFYRINMADRKHD